MKSVDGASRIGSRRRGPLAGVLAGVVAATAVLAGCQSGDGAAGAGGEPRAGAVAPATTPAAPAAAVTTSPGDGAAKVRLDKAVTVRVAQGTLASVTLTGQKGKAVRGKLSPDRLTWTSSSALRPGTTYTVAVDAAAADGRTTTTSSSFRTLKPKDTASASIQPGDGWVVGVGMPVIVDFSRSVSTSRRDDVEKALTVSTTDDIEGSWRWITAQQVQWRPAKYWPADTEVKVSADLAGVEVAKGVWGTAERTSDFTVGSAVISTVDVAGHTLTMRRNGKVVRTIPVTTGKASMATRSGVKIIMSRETVHRMRSETIGIEKGDEDFYDIEARYAMRLTYSGEFLHAAPWSMGSQGRANVSHGCTGMSTADAKWLFNHSKVGDVVVYKNSPRALESGNGYTAWNMSYQRWKSA